jgi:hypothetical protein
MAGAAIVRRDILDADNRWVVRGSNPALIRALAPSVPWQPAQAVVSPRSKLHPSHAPISLGTALPSRRSAWCRCGIRCRSAPLRSMPGWIHHPCRAGLPLQGVPRVLEVPEIRPGPGVLAGRGLPWRLHSLPTPGLTAISKIKIKIFLDISHSPWVLLDAIVFLFLVSFLFPSFGMPGFVFSNRTVSG